MRWMWALVLLMLGIGDAPPSRVYLPLVYTIPHPVRIVQVPAATVHHKIDHIRSLGVDLVRYNWGIGYVYGLYGTWWNQGWDGLAVVEADIASIREAGAEPLMVFHGNENDNCTPITRDNVEHHAWFVNEAVLRWDLKYIEIGNEPNFTGGHLGGGGCHGDPVLYGETLAAVYDVVRAETTVLFGGMGLAIGENPFWFYDAVIEHSGETFDVVAFHNYCRYPQTVAECTARAKMLVNGFVARTDKPIWNTEANYIHDSALCYTPGLFQQQADYITALLSIRQLDAVTVFALSRLPAWKCAALLDETGVPLPAYFALANLPY